MRGDDRHDSSGGSGVCLEPVPGTLDAQAVSKPEGQGQQTCGNEQVSSPRSDVQQDYLIRYERLFRVDNV